MQAAGSWQGAGQGSKGNKGRHGCLIRVGEVGGPLKLQAGVHQECRGPSCLGGVACARGRPDRDLSLLCL